MRRLFVREKINQRLFGIRQRVRGIRIGGRRGGGGRTGCRGCAIGVAGPEVVSKAGRKVYGGSPDESQGGLSALRVRMHGTCARRQ
jgi:hypothetical protein